MRIDNEIANSGKPMVSGKLSGVVACPNKCLNGQEKYYPNPERALFVMRPCQYCEGSGEVPEEKAKKIEAIL